jgi:hypothetical protein
VAAYDATAEWHGHLAVNARNATSKLRYEMEQYLEMPDGVARRQEALRIQRAIPAIQQLWENVRRHEEERANAIRKTFLEQNEPAQPRITLEVGDKQDAVRAACDIFCRLVGRGKIDDAAVSIRMRTNGRDTGNDGGSRSKYVFGQNSIEISQRAQVTGAVIHELAHWLEERAGLQDEVERHYLLRTDGGNERLTPLRAFGNSYHADEMTRPDTFAHAYMGKDYSVDRNPRGTRHELLAMALQLLFEDPAGLARTDPQTFDWVYGLLRRTRS